jgi:hypothetical protein
MHTRVFCVQLYQDMFSSESPPRQVIDNHTHLASTETPLASHAAYDSSSNLDSSLLNHPRPSRLPTTQLAPSSDIDATGKSHQTLIADEQVFRYPVDQSGNWRVRRPRPNVGRYNLKRKVPFKMATR